jgi:tellurium resistance protein TerD
MGLIKWYKKMQEKEKETAVKNAKLNEGKTKEDFLKQKIEENERLDKLGLNEDDLIRCPKCGSTQITSGNKGFSVGKAVVGDIVAGPVGLVAGAIGSKKTIITCLNCGHEWKAGKIK